MPWQHRRRSSDWRSARLAECACLVGNPFSVNPSCIELVFEYSATYVGTGHPQPLAYSQLITLKVIQLAQCVNRGVVAAGERKQCVALPHNMGLCLGVAPHDLHIAVASGLPGLPGSITATARLHRHPANFTRASTAGRLSRWGSGCKGG